MNSEMEVRQKALELACQLEGAAPHDNVGADYVLANVTGARYWEGKDQYTSLHKIVLGDQK